MIDAKEFMLALDELEKQKGVSKDDIILALKEAIRKAYVKSLRGGDDALVEVIIDPESGKIGIEHYKTIVDEVNDDYIEVSKRNIVQNHVHARKSSSRAVEL